MNRLQGCYRTLKNREEPAPPDMYQLQKDLTALEREKTDLEERVWMNLINSGLSLMEIFNFFLNCSFFKKNLVVFFYNF